MNIFTGLPASAEAATLQPIPYRTESLVSGGKVLSVLGVTVALLVVAAGLLLWARKCGWLRRWSVAASGGTPERNALRVLGQIRLGQALQAFLIEADGSRLVVVESSKHVSLHALPESVARSGEGDE